ncbi:helix-turn-helix domain-containing protein [Pseudomonas reactans]|nr:helix-turn-helix domain-containing protein [Pseudomonas reactans]
MTTNKKSQDIDLSRSTSQASVGSHRFQNWHPADIIAELHKRGTTLAALSRQSGLCSSTLSNALCRRWPRGEMLIANALGMTPAEIWPTRYFHPDGTLIVKNRKKAK